MKKIVGVVFCFWLWSCMQEDPEIGSNFFDDVSFEIVSWDTLSMKMYTVAFDSLPANSATRLLVGQMDHADLDSIQAQSYFQFSPDESYSLEDKDLEFVDAYLVLSYDGYYYGDTLSTLTLEVFELTEEMELDEDDLLYHHNSFAVELAAIGAHTFSPRPSSSDSVEILLSASFSTQLFGLLMEEDISTDDFLEIYHGLNIRTNSANVLVGFQPAPIIKINYLDKSGSISEEKELNLTVQAGQIQFNQIIGQKSGELFEGIDEELLPSADLGHKTYVQSGTGLATRIELPNLKNLLSRDDALVIDEVRMELVFENKIPEEVYMLAGALTLSKVDKNNEVLLNYSEVPEIVVDFDYKEERKLVIDIQEFVEEQLSINTPENDDALLIKFSNEIFNNSVDHLILSDQDRDKNSKIILNELKIK